MVIFLAPPRPPSYVVTAQGLTSKSLPLRPCLPPLLPPKPGPLGSVVISYLVPIASEHTNASHLTTQGERSSLNLRVCSRLSQAQVPGNSDDDVIQVIEEKSLRRGGVKDTWQDKAESKARL